jgi:hypothetical protein
MQGGARVVHRSQLPLQLNDSLLRICCGPRMSLCICCCRLGGLLLVQQGCTRISKGG